MQTKGILIMKLLEKYSSVGKPQEPDKPRHLCSKTYFITLTIIDYNISRTNTHTYVRQQIHMHLHTLISIQTWIRAHSNMIKLTSVYLWWRLKSTNENASWLQYFVSAQKRDWVLDWSLYPPVRWYKKRIYKGLWL